MSDGPHRSLPMRNGWRKLAERGANSNFQPAEIGEAIPEAVGDDWREEGCAQAASELRSILDDNRQGSLFGQEHEDRIDALKDVPSAGFPLRRMLIEHVVQCAEDGMAPDEALQAGTERALAERIVRGSLQVEEHYLRSGDQASNIIRSRISEGVASVPLKALANHLLNPKGSTSLPPSTKRDGLDDGPALP